MNALRYLIIVWTLGLTLTQGATVFLVAEGVIDQSLDSSYPGFEAGDAFKITVSYSDHSLDTNSDPGLGVYLPGDLSISLEILGEGVVFQSIGGSVNVSVNPQDFPVYSIISSGQPNGHTLFLAFSDNDRSSAPIVDDALPTSFGEFADYDSIGFSIVALDAPTVPTPPFPGSAPPNPLDGTVTSISVPEPESALLVGVALALIAGRRARNQKVESGPRD